LEKTKIASADIKEKVAQAREQEISINHARNEYKMVASEGSWLYFLLTQLQIISHMYQYSLDAFLFFFLKAMKLAVLSDNTIERVENLRQSIRITIFRWTNRGLFERHKQILFSMLTFKLMQKNALVEKLDPVHFDWLIRRPDAPPSVHLLENKLNDWLPTPIWNTLQSIAALEDFSKLCLDILASPNRFKEWYTKGRPEDAQLPGEWRKLDDDFPFRKLMIVRAMRADRITSAMKLYVERVLPEGKLYTECDAGKGFMNILEYSYEDSSPTTPIFFILSAGADPVSNVELLAKRNGFYGGKYHRVALGQGQDTVAELKLDLAQKEGHWVVLENIHLMPRWTRRLEKMLDDYGAEGSHKDFRVFMSAEPNENLPVGTL
jgi:dynein heavy chain, axonemal